ncbi:MAG: hypothetical protein HY662_03410 [Chloroflexi bacterium]|nr:hypothetical protein [Chloroflexota bacterium]
MKRKRIVVALLVVAISVLGSLSYYLFYVSGLVGFIAARFGGGKREGTHGRVKSITLSWYRYQLHLHHWFLGSIAAAVFALNGFYIVHPEFFYGFLGGMVFQGIYCYSDWHRIIRSKRQLIPEQSLKLE